MPTEPPAPEHPLDALLTGGGYLAFLHVGNVAGPLRLVQSALADTPDRTAALERLLDTPDWRPHLVAAVAAFVSPEHTPVEAFWARVAAGSWVVPQLAAVLSVVDPAYAARAGRLIEALLDAAPEQPAWGRRAKDVAALGALLEAPPSDPRFAALVAADPDWGGQLATRWLARMREALARPPVLHRMNLTVVEGNLVDQPVDVLVNAWNRNVIPWWLLLPQGVSGELKRRAGYAPFQELGWRPMPLGTARLTSAGRLPNRAIIHVAGIDLAWRASVGSVRDAVTNALRLAMEHGYESIAFPVIGAGSGGLAADVAERTMIETIRALDPPLDVVIVRWKR